MISSSLWLFTLLIGNTVLAQRSSDCSRFPLTCQTSGSSFGSHDSTSDCSRFPLTCKSSGSHDSNRDTFGGRTPSGGLNDGSDDFGFGMPNRGTSVDSDTFDPDNSDLFAKARIQAWPSATVPYEISSDISDGNANALKKMFAWISSKTCVQFVPRGRNDANYTYIKGGNGCSAPLGMSARPQQIGSPSGSRASGSMGNRFTTSGASVVTLAPGCFTAKRVARRIINLLGIPHETSRPDRDQFVEINMNNIRPGYTDNLKQYTASSYLPGVLDIPYDYQSVTQYTDEDLARNSNTWAIRPKKSRFTTPTLGGNTFSPADFQKISAAYGCRNDFGSRGSGSSNSRFGSGSG